MDERVSYYHHPYNIGSTANFIWGIRNVDTDLFSVLSDDDIIISTFFEKAIKAFTLFPEAMFVTTDYLKVDGQNRLLRGPILPEAGNEYRYFGSRDGFKVLASGDIPSPWIGTLFRKETISEIGLPNEAAGPNLNDNYILRITSRFPFVVCSAIGCVVTENPGSVGFQMGPLDREWRSWWEATVKDIEDDIKADPWVRENVRKLTMPDFRKMAFRQTTQGLGRFNGKDIEYARQAAIGAYHHGYFMTSLLLRTLAASYRHLFPVRWAINAAAKGRKKLRERQRIILQERYQHYLNFPAQIPEGSA
jgi:hypothetical protein